EQDALDYANQKGIKVFIIKNPNDQYSIGMGNLSYHADNYLNYFNDLINSSRKEEEPVIFYGKDGERIKDTFNTAFRLSRSGNNKIENYRIIPETFSEYLESEYDYSTLYTIYAIMKEWKGI